MGLPKDREQYIHRLGRTGRKGKEGEGILLLAPWEEYFLSSLKDLPITKSPLPSIDPETVKKVELKPLSFFTDVCKTFLCFKEVKVGMKNALPMPSLF